MGLPKPQAKSMWLSLWHICYHALPAYATTSYPGPVVVLLAVVVCDRPGRSESVATADLHENFLTTMTVFARGSRLTR